MVSTILYSTRILNFKNWNFYLKMDSRHSRFTNISNFPKCMSWLKFSFKKSILNQRIQIPQFHLLRKELQRLLIVTADGISNTLSHNKISVPSYLYWTSDSKTQRQAVYIVTTSQISELHLPVQQPASSASILVQHECGCVKQVVMAGTLCLQSKSPSLRSEHPSGGWSRSSWAGSTVAGAHWPGAQRFLLTFRCEVAVGAWAAGVPPSGELYKSLALRASRVLLGTEAI